MLFIVTSKEWTENGNLRLMIIYFQTSQIVCLASDPHTFPPTARKLEFTDAVNHKETIRKFDI